MGGDGVTKIRVFSGVGDEYEPRKVQDRVGIN